MVAFLMEGKEFKEISALVDSGERAEEKAGQLQSGVQVGSCLWREMEGRVPLTVS